MAIKELSPKFILSAIPLITGMLLLLWQENAPVWLVYSLMAIGLIFLKPIFDGWMQPFWKLLIGLCALVLLLEIKTISESNSVFFKDFNNIIHPKNAPQTSKAKMFNH